MARSMVRNIALSVNCLPKKNSPSTELCLDVAGVQLSLCECSLRKSIGNLSFMASIICLDPLMTLSFQYPAWFSNRCLLEFLARLVLALFCAGLHNVLLRNDVGFILSCLSVTLSGERVLCFHGPLLYEAKVCVIAYYCR